MKAKIVFFLFLFFGAKNIFASYVEISKETVNQGEFFEVFMKKSPRSEIFTVIFQERKYVSAWDEHKNSQRVIIPVGIFDSIGEVEILIESKITFVVPQKITIKKSEFGESTSVEVVKPLSSNELAKYEKEQKMLESIYQRTTKHQFFSPLEFFSPFEYPLKNSAKVSSPYGFLRKRKVGAKSEKVEMVSHWGADLVVPKGESVIASSTGIVRFAGNLINSGNTIIIDHGYNVFSVYMHLSKFLISEGDVILSGDQIALSGDTGRVTGAHLHFAVRIWDKWVDPKYFVKGLEEKK